MIKMLSSLKLIEWFVCQIHGRVPMKRARSGEEWG